MFSRTNTRPVKFSPNLAEIGTRFLRGTRRSLHVFSRGKSHFMWRRKFSLRIDRMTLTMLVLLSLSLGRRGEETAVPSSVMLRAPMPWSFRVPSLISGQTDGTSPSRSVPWSPHLQKKSEVTAREVALSTKIWIYT